MLPDPRFRPAPRRPDAVALVWIAGLALAVLAYAVGPELLVSHVLDAFGRASDFINALAHQLTLATREVLRALAIGLFGTFVGLSLLAIRRGTQGPVGLIVVALVFLLLVWDASGDSPGANVRWAAALLLAVLAALSATHRLTRPPPRR